mgnify:FL=1
MIIILSIFNMIFIGKVKASLFVSFKILEQQFYDNHSFNIQYDIYWKSKSVVICIIQNIGTAV